MSGLTAIQRRVIDDYDSRLSALSPNDDNAVRRLREVRRAVLSGISPETATVIAPKLEAYTSYHRDRLLKVPPDRAAPLPDLDEVEPASAADAEPEPDIEPEPALEQTVEPLEPSDGPSLVEALVGMSVEPNDEPPAMSEGHPEQRSWFLGVDAGEDVHGVVVLRMDARGYVTVEGINVSAAEALGMVSIAQAKLVTEAASS